MGCSVNSKTAAKFKARMKLDLVFRRTGTHVVCIYISLYVAAALTLGCGNCCDSDIVITMNHVSSDTQLCLELIGSY